MCEGLSLVSFCVQGPGSNLALKTLTRLRAQGTVAILMNSSLMVLLNKYLQLIFNLHVKRISVQSEKFENVSASSRKNIESEFHL